ncbi:MAG: hypothetical protein HY331_19300, partial [Chloroflexi bacterium]|nr:hypothetical protein [Chloroflexota bacterium]
MMSSPALEKSDFWRLQVPGEPERLGIRAALAFPLRGPLPPLLLFLGCALAVFRDSLAEGRVFSQVDTLIYYVPLARRIGEAFAQGRFPLWTSTIFGGHPIFAESEAAMLYPPNLLAWLLLPTDAALVWLRILRFFLAGAFSYAFGRTIGLSRSAATIAGLSFAYGSFLVGQIHHKNLADAAIWLPLLLCLVERGLQATGARRWRWWLLAGLAFGVQLLTIHINPVLMTLMLLAAYVAARVTFLRPESPGGCFAAAQHDSTGRSPVTHHSSLITHHSFAGGLLS